LNVNIQGPVQVNFYQTASARHFQQFLQGIEHFDAGDAILRQMVNQHESLESVKPEEKLSEKTG
jgi:hypothetical protein